MTWSGTVAIWKSWGLGVFSAFGVALVAYWQSAPNLLRIAAVGLGPLLMLEAVSASWMHRQARKKHPDMVYADAAVLPVPGLPGEKADPFLLKEYGAEVFPGDTWARAGLRFGMTFVLVCLAAVVDTILGTRHMTVLWVLLWGTSGHTRAILRHMDVVAKLNHMELPIFPEETRKRMEQLRQESADDEVDAAPATELPRHPSPPAPLPQGARGGSETSHE